MGPAGPMGPPGGSGPTNPVDPYDYNPGSSGYVNDTPTEELYPVEEDMPEDVPETDMDYDYVSYDYV